jgi:phosphate transport system protein
MNSNKFERELSELHENIIKLGAAAERAIDCAISALMNRDAETAEAVIEGDKHVNALAALIESEALKILLRRQPLASDLLTISTALKMVTDMERIGDQARDICEIVLHLRGMEYASLLALIPRMAELAKRMVNMCIDSFVRRDAAIAEKVIETDDEVDILFAKVKENMIQLLRESPGYADQAIYLMMTAKYFEKIGDHAENIAEWVLFGMTGERKNVRLL